MKEISLTRGKFAIVDDADYEILNVHKWMTHVYKWTRKDGTRKELYYAARMTMVNGRRKMLFMHHEIIGRVDGMQTDHANGNGLDNRKENLRTCTPLQNMVNRGAPNKTSGFRGVTFEPGGGHRANPWRSKIKNNGKTYLLGRFPDPVSAANAYDRRAKELYGCFARLNFPEEAHAACAN